MIVKTDEKNYQDIANAIRSKLGTDATYLPSEMAGAIERMKIGEFDLIKYGASAETQIKLNSIINEKIKYSANNLKDLKKIIGSADYKYYYDGKMYYFTDVDMSEVTTAISIFRSSGVCYINIQDLQNCTDLTNLCSSAYLLEEAYIYGTKKVINFGNAFFDCWLLKNISVIDTQSAVQIQGFFNGCTYLEEAKLTSIENVTRAESFCNAHRLKKLEFDRWKQTSLSLLAPALSVESINYIIEHALGEEDGATARTLTLHATAKANWMDTAQNPDYEYYQAMATEKLITIA